MTIEVKEGRFFLGMWFFDYPGGNFMGAMYRDGGDETEWTFRCRLATADHEEKSWFTITCPVEKDLDYVLVRCQEMISEAVKATDMYGVPGLKVHFLNIRSQDPEFIQKTLLSASFARVVTSAPGGEA